MENNAAISPDTKMADSPKESSWTFYIQGFMFGNDGETTASLSSEFESPSLVSDADSSPTKKPTMTLNDHCNPVLSSPKHTGIVRTMDRLGSFKKRKTESMNAVDYDFEDTASSPANSPKVCHENPFTDQKGKAKLMDVAKVRRKTSPRIMKMIEFLPLTWMLISKIRICIWNFLCN